MSTKKKFVACTLLLLAFSSTAFSQSPVTGSGTAGKVPQWTGTSTLGDSEITQSGSKIGIGTSNPNAKLHVDNSGAEDFIQAGNAAFRVTNTGDVFVRGVKIGEQGAQGPQGPTGPQGLAGPRGAAGAPTRTYAVCSVGNCECSRLLTRQLATCTVTSDSGSCTMPAVSGPSGSCCVCAP